MQAEIERFIKGLPKCDIHIHLFGNTEPEMIFALAKRNGIQLKWDSPEHLKQAYCFNNLQEFLELFRAGEIVIKTEQDIYDITYDYFIHAHQDNITHCELHFSPNAAMQNGMPIEQVMNGVTKAIDDAKENFGITCYLVACVERHLPESLAFKLIDLIEPWRKYYIAAGLASAELPFPPNMFVGIFAEYRKRGYKISIHAGEEGPADYINQSIELLKADRIDHGNACLQDQTVVTKLVEKKIPCTLCPLSNLRLQVVKDLKDHPLKKMMNAGIICSVNSDDPSFFRGYLNDNFIAIQQAINLTKDDIVTLAKNSYLSSFLPEDEKQKGIELVDQYVKNFGEISF